MRGRHVELVPVESDLPQASQNPQVNRRPELPARSADPFSFSEALSGGEKFIFQAAIRVRPTGRLIGHLGIKGYDARCGIASAVSEISPTHTGGPWAVEAGILFVEQAFRELPLRKIYSEMPARILYQFKRAIGSIVEVEATLRQHRYEKGHFRDWVVIAISRDSLPTLEQWRKRLQDLPPSRHHSLRHHKRSTAALPLAVDAENQLPDVASIEGSAFTVQSEDGSGNAPPLATSRVRLRPLRAGDQESLYQLSLKPETIHLWRYRGTTPSPSEFERSLWQNVLTQFVIERRRDGELAGLIYAYNADFSSGYAYMAVLVAPIPGRPVILSEAALLFINFLFASFPFRKLYIESGERSMKRLAGGVGRYLNVEGRLRAHEYFNGSYSDMVISSLWREQWLDLAHTRLPLFLANRKARVGEPETRGRGEK